LVDHPEAELVSLTQMPNTPERLERFGAAAENELQSVRGFITSRASEFQKRSGLDIYALRVNLISKIYLNRTSDVTTAFEDFLDMYRQIKLEESSLYDKLEINISFDDSAIDELIRQAIETGEETGHLTYQLAKKLEYGLKLVKDRSGTQNFVINREAVTDMENYINGLVTRFYREEYEPFKIENHEKD